VGGTIESQRVALFQGRGHYYERGDANAMRIAIETFRKLGGETLLLTNAAGGLKTEWRPPALVAITDHINFSGMNPLIGYSGADRFVPLTKAYDAALITTLHEAARSAAVELNEGVYMWFSGPSFETPAEIRAARILGADLVGMSTVPEVILARRGGLRCAAVSVVTNYAAGLARATRSHDETQAVANEAADRFARAAQLHPLLSAATRMMLPQEIIRAKRRRDRRGEIGDFIAAYERRGHRGTGRRLRHGDILSRHVARRTCGADPGDDALRGAPRLARREPARPDPRQALDRGRRRQCLADAGANARGLRRLCADDFRARLGSHRRHGRQTRFDPRLQVATPT
jgi:purine-nucleoside phosphorylase